MTTPTRCGSGTPSTYPASASARAAVASASSWSGSVPAAATGMMPKSDGSNGTAASMNPPRRQ
jgi:hypothetical protein